MPVTSKAMFRKMAIGCKHPGKMRGRRIKRSVACEYLEKSRGIYGRLPERKSKRSKRRAPSR